ncbi:MAG: UbiD family decarboxylase associated with menaquinone via futalosine [Ktedonobacterales bacterium]|jgi:4-hydroxy-3-polyprenylbenzoate decarboxylase|nr:MAG: UbiD family decarboxylase associated with menaquinone via futalosine [Ktedonobacterales bacterium]
MAFQDLREFITFIEKRGQLRRISAPVSADLEITEITDRVSKAGGPALLFENVRGYAMPVVINLFGSEERMAWALGVQNLDELGARIQKWLDIVQNRPPEGLIEKAKLLPELAELARIFPHTVSHAPCQEVVITDKPDITTLPILQCWPQDAGKYLTLTMCHSKDPNTGKRNIGMYRVQVRDGQTVGMHWQIHKGGAAHFRDAQVRAKQRMEVAVVIGADPASVYSASAPLPPGVDELLFAGFLRRKAVEVVQCKTVDVKVPAHAEIVIEGYVDTDELLPEGPFGDHTGYYTPVEPYPVMHITAVTHRRNPIYATTIVGKPPMEDAYLGKATERFFLHLLRVVLPEIVDMNMPIEGGFHNVVIVSIRKRYPGQAKKVMAGIWGMMLMMLSKFIIVVDEHVNVQNLRDVLFYVGNNVDPKRDTLLVDGPVDALDHSSPYEKYGWKMGLDATAKLPEEGHPRPWPDEIVMSPEIKELVTKRWAEYGIQM